MTDFLMTLVARTLGATCIVSPDLPLELAADTAPVGAVITGDSATIAATTLPRILEAALGHPVSPSPAPLSEPSPMPRAHQPTLASPEMALTGARDEGLAQAAPRHASLLASRHAGAATSRTAPDASMPLVPRGDAAHRAIVRQDFTTSDRMAARPDDVPLARSRDAAVLPVEIRVDREAHCGSRTVVDAEPRGRPTTVRISIGRIDVHAAPTRGRRDLTRSPAAPRPAIELDAYLKQRRGPQS